MVTFSKDQIDFFKHHNITESDVLDATGMPTSAWKLRMKQTGQKLAVGVSRCKKGGHQLRTRGGHCAVCDPSQLSFSRRAYQEGIVYLLQSQSTGLVKIGMTSNLSERLANLRSQHYGGADDWRVLRKSETLRNAGRIEKALQKQLDGYRAEGGVSIRAGVDQASIECFLCSREVAIDVFKNVLASKSSKAA